MKVGIMGGTFDPIHIGHLLAAEQAREGMGLDEVWFIPVYQPPHKDNEPIATPEQRLEMVKAAIVDHAAFKCNDIELQRGGKSYTLDTVRELQAAHPSYAFYHIIGADMVQYLPHWDRIDELIQYISFIGLQRPGHAINWESLGEAIRKTVHLVPMLQVDISSTVIRLRKQSGSSIRFLVPESVHHYIEENRLYE